MHFNLQHMYVAFSMLKYSLCFIICLHWCTAEQGLMARQRKQEANILKWEQTQEDKKKKLEESKQKEEEKRKEVEQRKKQMLEENKVSVSLLQDVVYHVKDRKATIRAQTWSGHNLPTNRARERFKPSKKAESLQSMLWFKRSGYSSICTYFDYCQEILDDITRAWK